MLETSASHVQFLYGGQFTLSTQLNKPNHLVLLKIVLTFFPADNTLLGDHTNESF